MCGISGKLRWDGRPVEQAVRAMTMRMRHRGPDHQAVVDVDGVACLGHARLSIIDLDQAANQPMSTPDGRFHLVYNGEVYNFLDIRKELETAGCHFRTRSDTEVVLHALVTWGPRALERFNGMFGLALWDTHTRELLLARDRFGKKPLFYTFLGGAFSFASESSALGADPEVAPLLRPSVRGLTHVLAIGYILNPHSIHEGVFQVPPAHWLRVRDGKIADRIRYWDYAAAFRRRCTDDLRDAEARIEDLIARAVERRLVADVPVGAFLSGGVDSSSVVGFMRRHLPYDLHTFSIGFEEPSYDEASDARVMAEHLRTLHHDRHLATADGRALIDRALAAYDEPLADTSLVPMVELARVAAEQVTVVLSGDGADEVFSGYPTYIADLLKQALDLAPRSARRLAARLALHAPVDPRSRLSLGFKLRQFAKGLVADRHRAHFAWREIHTEPERIALIGAEHADEIRASDPFLQFCDYYNEAQDLDPLSQHLYVDAKTWLVDDILVKVDRATMAASLECRAPYLDVDLCEYVAGLPSTWKQRLHKGKWILKRTLAGSLPRSTLRKKKTGFNAPINAWLGHTDTDEFRYFSRLVLERRFGNISEIVKNT